MPSRWLESARRLRQAIRPAGTSAPRRNAAPSEPPAASAAPAGFIAVIVDGFGADEIAQILDTVERTSAAARLRPVVITHATDLSLYRRRFMPVEVLADPTRQPASMRQLPWHELRRAQLAAVVRLWRPLAAASFARPANPELLAELRDAIAQPATADQAR